jgi:hypothetical protein
MAGAQAPATTPRLAPAGAETRPGEPRNIGRAPQES